MQKVLDGFIKALVYGFVGFIFTIGPAVLEALVEWIL